MYDIREWVRNDEGYGREHDIIASRKTMGLCIDHVIHHANVNPDTTSIQLQRMADGTDGFVITINDERFFRCRKRSKR